MTSGTCNTCGGGPPVCAACFETLLARWRDSARTFGWRWGAGLRVTLSIRSTFLASREALCGPSVLARGTERSSSFTDTRKLALGRGTFNDAKASRDNAERHELTDQAHRFSKRTVVV